jgi:hypothetical protein
MGESFLLHPAILYMPVHASGKKRRNSGSQAGRTHLLETPQIGNNPTIE